VRFVTFNIQHGAQGLDRVGDVLVSLVPDVVFLQEVDRGCQRTAGVDQLEVLARRLGFASAFGEAFPFDGGSYGVGILSRTPLSSDRVVLLPSPTGERADSGHNEQRVVLLAETDGFLLASTHLGLSDEERGEQAAAIRRALADATNTILGGDLNEGPGGGVWGQWKGWLSDAMTEVHAQEIVTAPDDRPHTRIDFIGRGSATPSVTRAFVGPSGASDHRPVIVDLEDAS